jgi:hypothetical protein
MTDPAESSSADIAWMRRLAEENGQAPMQGASILFMAGLLYGLAGLFHWATVARLLPFASEESLWIGWLAATLLFFATLVIVINRLKRQPGVVTTANKASGIAWSAMGWGIFALFLSLSVVGYRLGGAAAEALFGLVPSVILVFYGIGWAISASMHRARPLWGLALGSFAAAPVLAAFTGSPDQYLAYSISLLLFMALPGFLLMRAAKQA